MKDGACKNSSLIGIRRIALKFRAHMPIRANGLFRKIGHLADYPLMLHDALKSHARDTRQKTTTRTTEPSCVCPANTCGEIQLGHSRGIALFLVRHASVSHT